MRVLFCVFVFCCACVCAKVTPDYFPQCKRSDPELEKCILKGVESIRPKLLEGIPELAIPALEPFVLPTLKLDRTAPNLRIKATIKNMKAFGGSHFRIDKLKLDLNNKYVGEVRLFIPRLQVTADYDVKGSRVLVVDIDGKGRLSSNFTGISVAAKGSAKTFSKDGVDYLQAEKIIMKVKINHGQVAFADTERPVAATSAASFFNASPSTVLSVLSPLIEDTGAAVLKAYINKVFSKIPLSEILIEDKPAA